jgi:hypothetical protein
MKLSSFIIAAMLCVAFVPLLSAEANGETEVFTTVTTEKDVYNTTEPIDITVAVTNAGSDTVRIPFSSSLQQYYCVYRLETGSVVYNLWGHVIVLYWLTNITLGPGETDSWTIHNTTGKDSWARASVNGTPVRSPGYYVIEGLLDSWMFDYEIGQKVIAISDNMTSPSASIKASKNEAAAGEDILFDASDSTDVVQNSLLEYRWDWEADGSYDTNWTNVSSAMHSFTEAGVHFVKVQIRDPAGLENEATTSVFIDTVLPEFPALGLVVLGLLVVVLALSRTRR